MAPTIAETTSERVETMTLAAKVEAFMPWSDAALRYVSRARTNPASGFSPLSMYR
jgi:hypothetical protein